MSTLVDKLIAASNTDAAIFFLKGEDKVIQRPYAELLQRAVFAAAWPKSWNSIAVYLAKID